MNVHIANGCEFCDVARLHSTSITTGFLSRLGTKFLEQLYKSINETDGAMVIVAESEGKVIGFVAGTLNTNGLFRKIVLSKWYRFIVPLVKSVFNSRNVIMIIETILYGFKEKNVPAAESINAELLSISVDGSIRGKGVGKRLVDELEILLKKNGITKYKVVTFSKDERANKFYCSCRFKLFRSFKHHGNTMNEYVKELL